MGLLDNLTGMLGGGAPNGEQGEGAANIIGSLLQQGGEGQSSGIVGALLGGLGGGAAGGGMAATLESLAANGLADQVGSWLSNNPNLPISPDQIRSALGDERVQQMAASSGLPVGDFLSHLAEHLPGAAAENAGTANG